MIEVIYMQGLMILAPVDQILNRKVDSYPLDRGWWRGPDWTKNSIVQI